MATDHDAALITDVLSTTPLCDGCIARQAGLTLARLEEVFLRVVVTNRVVSHPGRCDCCLEATTAHRIA